MSAAMTDIVEISADDFDKHQDSRIRFPHLLQLEFYAVDDRQRGIVTRDRIGMDFGYIVLAWMTQYSGQSILRVNGGIDTQDEARKKLFEEMEILVTPADPAPWEQQR